MIRKRISDWRSLGSWCIKGTGESLLRVDSPVPLMHHDPNDLRSVNHWSFFGSSKRNAPFSLSILMYDFSPFGRDNKVVNKPLITLKQRFPAPEIQPSLVLQTNIVEKILCASCLLCYIGETGRAFKYTRKKNISAMSKQRQRLKDCKSCLATQSHYWFWKHFYHR